MRRGEFMAGLAGAVSWAIAAHGQQNACRADEVIE
jgi:hypothetical protein